MTSKTLRLVEAGDVDAIESLLQQESENNGYFFNEDNPYHPMNAAVAIVNASIDEKDINCGWLAFCDGRPAGIITTPQGLAGGVFVSSEFRNQGIAQALIQEREYYFKSALHLTEIERPVRADNIASIKLHERLGYKFSAATCKLLAETPKPPRSYCSVYG